MAEYVVGFSAVSNQALTKCWFDMAKNCLLGQLSVSLAIFLSYANRDVLVMNRDVKRSSNIRTSKKIFEFEFVFDPSKFDFQIPTGLNSAKSVLWLH